MTTNNINQITCLLAIETSTEICSVALSKNTECIAIVENEQGNSHAEKIILYVNEVLQQAGLKKSQLNAVCISEGPGSYTGLRIGVSSAKGLCDALNIPLIAVSTLQSMAWGAREQYPDYKLFSPMIDAKRMEVYTAVYDQYLQPVQKISNIILDENAYSDFLFQDKLVFSGNGITKAQSLLSGNSNAIFCNRKTSARYMLALAYEKFLRQDFVDLAYFEPFYLKEFHAVKPKIKGL
jgi:tRNA threonylcarbamoyladenosine biosynthesis protein TsaB